MSKLGVNILPKKNQLGIYWCLVNLKLGRKWQFLMQNFFDDRKPLFFEGGNDYFINDVNNFVHVVYIYLSTYYFFLSFLVNW